MFQYQVVAMSGEEARKVFFNEKNLNFTEGYRLLMGAVSEFSIRTVYCLGFNLFTGPKLKRY